MKKYLVLILLLALQMQAGSAISAEKKEGDDRTYVDGIEVIVNDSRVTYSEIDLELHRYKLSNPDADVSQEINVLTRVIHNLITEHLLYQLAVHEQIQINDRVLDDIVAKQVKEIGGEDKLIQKYFPLKILADRELTIDDARKYLARIEMIHAVLRLKTSVPQEFATPKKIKDYYGRHKHAWVIPASVKYRIIQADYILKDAEFKPKNYKEFKNGAEAKIHAEEILKRLKAGADFIKIATEESTSPWCTEGGLYTSIDEKEWFQKENILPIWAGFLFEEGRKSGDISDVIAGEKRKNGEISYFILKLEDIRAKRILSFKEAQQFIKAKIIEDEQSRLRMNLIKSLYKQAYIYPKEYRKIWTGS